MGFENTSSPVLVSHRGIKVHAAENTRESFEAAIAQGYTHLETDLRATRDGHIVLCHDPDLMRIAGIPLRVSEATRSELQAVRLLGGQSLMFFDDFMSRFAPFNWVFDIKPETSATVVQLLVAWAKVNNAVELIGAHVKLLCSNDKDEAELLRFFGAVPCYARESECWRAGLAVLAGFPQLGAIRPGRTYSVPPAFARQNLFRPRIANSFHSAGARILAFLPTSLGQVSEALAAGFDEVLSDHAYFLPKT